MPLASRGEGEEQAALSDLKTLLEKVVSLGRRQGGDVTLEMEGDICLMLRPMAFERCLMNLVNNACKYASHVRVEAARIEDKVLITVDDDGPGIPESEYEEVFRPFYRLDSSRNAETGGVGLGLPIAMDIVHTHGGRIMLEKSNLGGLRVVIRLPV